ncbi:MAG: ABC transporter permease [Chthoniobacterales bacterium]
MSDSDASSRGLARRFYFCLLAALSDLWNHRSLATVMAIRDTKAKYRSSMLGVFWAVAPPILAAVGLTAARNSGMLNLGPTPIPYPVFVILGVSLWQIFTSALTQPGHALSAARGLLTKMNFPREVVVLSELNKLLASVCIHLILVSVVFLIYRVPIVATVPLVVFPLASLIVLGLACGLLLAPAALLIGDILNALPFLTGAFLVVTPVVYVVPTGEGWFAAAVRANPLTPVFETARYLISAGIPPHPEFFILVFFSSFILLAVALVVFRASMPIVVERWSS